MSKLTVEFEYEIGEIVYAKTALHNSAHTPAKFIVQSRWCEECHGGCQQKYYTIRDAGKVSHFVPEMALSREAPPYEQMAEGRWDEIKSKYLKGENDR